MNSKQLAGARKHLCRLMDAARLAGDAEGYQALQDQLAATY